MAGDVRWMIVVLFNLSLASASSPQQDDSDYVEAVASVDLYDDNVVFFELIEPPEVAYIYKILPARDFGSLLNYTLHAVELVITSPRNSCNHISNSYYLKGNVAFVERGVCSFLSKAVNAEHAGAIAVIIADDNASNDDTLVDMVTDGSSRTSNIPAFFMRGKDGFMIERALRERNVESALINIPLNVTAASVLLLRLAPWSLW